MGAGCPSPYPLAASSFPREGAPVTPGEVAAVAALPAVIGPPLACCLDMHVARRGLQGEKETTPPFGSSRIAHLFLYILFHSQYCPSGTTMTFDLELVSQQFIS